MRKRISILGTYVNALTMKETIEEIEKIIEKGECIQHVVINAAKINILQKNNKLKNIINGCPLINADGQSIVWASKLLKKGLPERVTGIDLFQELVKISCKKGYKLYFFGATQEVVEKVVNIYKNLYPDINIVGYRNGYFGDEESLKIAETIRNSKPDILFVGFSSPKKEYWINEYKNIMNVPFAMGVGGSFDIIAGKTKRAPRWMQKCGLEWFYRFIQEPKRMWKRYIIGNFKFIILVLYEKITNLKGA